MRFILLSSLPLAISFSLPSPKACTKCQEIASPSRSSSVARIMLEAFLASSFNFSTISFALGGITYLGSKLCSTSMPILLLGKSRTWPKDASTRYLLSKKREIVLALVGDSTMINGLDIGRFKNQILKLMITNLILTGEFFFVKFCYN